MLITEYQALAMRTAKNFPELTMNLIHAALGIGSETGELAETVNCIWMDTTPRVPLKAGEQLVDNMKEEIGDATWYTALLSAHMGWEFHDLLITDQSVVRELSYMLHKASMTFSPVAIHECATMFAGEVLTIIKAHTVYGKPLNEQELKLNASLFLTSLAYLCELNGILFAGALDHNIAKLRKRYPDKYSDADALARADKV